MMNPPSTIKVGPYLYRVEMREDDAGSDVWARIRYRKRLIRIDASMSLEGQRVALFHELSHAVNEILGYSEEEYWPKDDELHVSATSPLWVMVLRDNPDLVRYLIAEDESAGG